MGGVSTWYAYNGEDIVAEFDDGGNLSATFDHSPGIDEPIQMVRGGGQFVYTRDGLGSVSEITDSAGSIAQQYAYSSFGETRILDSLGNNVTSTPLVQSPYGYTGRELDSESGNYFYRARYYSPSTGRFLSEDPIGFGGEDFNLFAYVGNNPQIFRDPDGLQKSICRAGDPRCLNGDNGIGGGGIGSGNKIPTSSQLIQSSRRASRAGSKDPRGLQALKKKVDRGNSAFKGSKKSQTDAERIINDIINSENKIINRTSRGTIRIFDSQTGRGIRIKEGEFDTFLNQCVGR